MRETFLQKITTYGSYIKTESVSSGVTVVTETTYIDGILYENYAETKIMREVGDDYNPSEDENASNEQLPAINKEDITSITLYEFDGAYYLILDVKTSVLKDAFDMSIPEEVDLNVQESCFRINLNSEGKFASAEMLMDLSADIENVTASFDITLDIAVSDIDKTTVTAPVDADEYEPYDPDFDWDETLVTIYFDTDGGTLIDPLQQMAGTPITAPADPIRGSDVFLGWFLANGTPYAFNVMPEEDLVLYAKYRTEFTVTFKFVDPNGAPMALLDNGMVQYSCTVKAGGVVDQPLVVNSLKAFENYVIVGWDSDDDGVADDHWKTVKSNCVVTSVARAKVNYDIKFYKENGELYQVVSMKEGTSVADYDVEPPVESGKYFKYWTKIEGMSPTNLITDASKFRATYGTSDGTIGKVAKNTIMVDGIKEPAYATDGTGSGAYLPMNMTNVADHRSSSKPSALPTSKADASVVWDGDYIYLFVEVYDRTLVGRSLTYNSMAGSYLKDAVEIWYYFEQKATNAGDNNTCFGVTAVPVFNGSTYKTLAYADSRIHGIGNGRSTHYDETFAVARSALESLNDPKFEGVFDPAGIEKPSYVVEIAFPAYTEGKADTSIWGVDIDTGRKPGASPYSDAPEDYAFTSGTKLVAGDYVRFNIQINDLNLSQSDISGGKFFDCPAGVTGKNYWLFYAENGQLKLGYDGNPIELKADDPITGTLFAAGGNTQHETKYYIMFTLGNTSEGQTKIWGLSGRHDDRKFYTTKDCRVGTEYVRPVN